MTIRRLDQRIDWDQVAREQRAARRKRERVLDAFDRAERFDELWRMANDLDVTLDEVLEIVQEELRERES